MIGQAHKTTKESVTFIRKGDLEVLHTLRKAREALCSIMFFMLALLKAVIYNLESQRRKKSLISAISNAM